ncbi:hypothetical protein BR93DRAFT_936752 [Coniochaeta sp. PMI_546]|nr:hypothetical protein BR93DRAFT_936752 [Coniochaeta sp. PMI_546]
MKLAQAAYILSSNRFASPESGSPRIQDKDQSRAEQQAKDPKMMANLGKEKNKKRDDPHLTSGDLSTPVVKDKSRQDDRIGRNINTRQADGNWSGAAPCRCMHGLVFEDAQDASLPDGEYESRIFNPLLFSNADTRHLGRVHASTNLRAWFDAQLLQRVLLSSLKPWAFGSDPIGRATR